MSFFSWFSAKKKPGKASAPAVESSGLSRMEATRPVTPRRGQAPAKDSRPQQNGQPANRKGERMARRELLYTVVRECMVRAGVLSASYKFKVLSLDARGRQFLVMVDVAHDSRGEASRFAEIEASIAQSAKSRYDIVVTAVYWRMSEHVAVGLPATRPVPHATPSRPAPLESQPAALHSQPAVLHSEPAPLISEPAPLVAQPAAPLVPERTGGRFEPIAEDEVAAFQRALAAGIATRPVQPRPQPKPQPAAKPTARSFDGAAKHGPQSYTLLTGFEDTEMPESDPRQPALSGTQYGELR